MEENQHEEIPKPIDIDTRDKLCQSCIERQYSTPNKATKMWTNGYYICEECYQPLLNNLLGGIPSHFSDIITSEDVLDNRDKIFNFHHNAIVNYSNEELIAHLEEIKKVLFVKRIEAEATQELINKYRAKNRAESGITKSQSEVKKLPQLGAVTKLKKSKAQKELDALAKTLGGADAMKKLMEQARQQEFKGLLEGKPQPVESKKENQVETKDYKIGLAPKPCPLCKEIVEGGLLKHYSVCPVRNKK